MQLKFNYQKTNSIYKNSNGRFTPNPSIQAQRKDSFFLEGKTFFINKTAKQAKYTNYQYHRYTPSPSIQAQRKGSFCLEGKTFPIHQPKKHHKHTYF